MEMRETARNERAIDECVNQGTILVIFCHIDSALSSEMSPLSRLMYSTYISPLQLPPRFLSADVKRLSSFTQPSYE